MRLPRVCPRHDMSPEGARRGQREVRRQKGTQKLSRGTYDPTHVYYFSVSVFSEESWVRSFGLRARRFAFTCSNNFSRAYMRSARKKTVTPDKTKRTVRTLLGTPRKGTMTMKMPVKINADSFDMFQMEN